MRVRRPKQQKLPSGPYDSKSGASPPKGRAHRHGLAVAMFGVLAVIGVGAYLSVPHNRQQVLDSNPIIKKHSSQPTKIEVVEPPQTEKTTLKTFTAAEFQKLYESIAYPNTTAITDPPPITGNVAADNHIRAVAESRGYKLRSIPLEPISKIGDPGLGDDDLLQPKALQAWRELQSMAKQDGIPLKILSGYRSPQYQRDLFMSRFLAAGGSVALAAAGKGDATIQQVMSVTAVPGYSRHHTGYTVDLQCDRFPFVATSCFSWISKNNYQKAKLAGWIPSYPEGASAQGPEPEPWEYVWVGKEAVLE